jgi:hypothetical protein
MPAAPASLPSAVSGPVTLSADAGLAPRGGVVRLTVTVAGPVRVAAPCAAPVSLVVSDPTGIHVFSDAPAAQPGDLCGNLALTTGQSAVFHLRWNVDPTLPSGRYTVAASAGDQPEISVSVEVGGAVAGAPAC